jgi:hypothetical protein
VFHDAVCARGTIGRNEDIGVHAYAGVARVGI